MRWPEENLARSTKQPPMFTVSGWRYHYRRYLGFMPVQWCMVCGRAYWGGFPRFWLVSRLIYIGDDCITTFTHKTRRWRLECTWQAWWQDYCSSSCCQKDPSAPAFHTKPASEVRCSYCGRVITEWVDPDWSHGRICLKCEAQHEPMP